MGCGGGGSDPGAEARAQQQKNEALIRQGTEQVNSIFGQFGPEFYKKRAQAYTDYAMPQLQQQFGQQQQNLAYKLYGQGLQQSSVGRELQNTLGQELTKQTQNIANQGLQQAQDLQRTLTGEQANTIAQLQASADPSTAAQQALSYASQAQAPSAFAPIGRMFTDWGQIYNVGQQNQMANQYANQLGMNPGLTALLGGGVNVPTFGIQH